MGHARPIENGHRELAVGRKRTITRFDTAVEAVRITRQQVETLLLLDIDRHFPDFRVRGSRATACRTSRQQGGVIYWGVQLLAL